MTLRQIGCIAGSESDEYLWPARECFPLGRGLDRPESDLEPASDPATRPFGLRYLRRLEAVGAIGTQAAQRSKPVYCSQRQMSMIGGQPLIFMATRVEYPTGTETTEDNQKISDKDKDYQSD